MTLLRRSPSLPPLCGLFIVLTAATLLTGCSKVPVLSAAPEPELPEGWRMAENTDERVRIAAPPRWGTRPIPEMLNLGGETSLESVPAEVIPLDVTNAQMQAQFDESSSKHMILRIVDLNVRPLPGEAHTGYRIYKLPTKRSNSLNRAAKRVQVQFKLHGEPQTVSLPVGEAKRFQFNYKNALQEDVYKIAYVLLDGQATYVVLFIQQFSGETIQALEKPVMETFRVDRSSEKS